MEEPTENRRTKHRAIVVDTSQLDELPRAGTTRYTGSRHRLPQNYSEYRSNMSIKSEQHRQKRNMQMAEAQRLLESNCINEPAIQAAVKANSAFPNSREVLSLDISTKNKMSATFNTEHTGQMGNQTMIGTQEEFSEFNSSDVHITTSNIKLDSSVGGREVDLSCHDRVGDKNNNINLSNGPHSQSLAAALSPSPTEIVGRGRGRRVRHTDTISRQAKASLPASTFSHGILQEESSCHKKIDTVSEQSCTDDIHIYQSDTNSSEDATVSSVDTPNMNKISLTRDKEVDSGKPPPVQRRVGPRSELGAPECTKIAQLKQRLLQRREKRRQELLENVPLKSKNNSQQEVVGLNPSEIQSRYDETEVLPDRKAQGKRELVQKQEKSVSRQENILEEEYEWAKSHYAYEQEGGEKNRKVHPIPNESNRSSPSQLKTQESSNHNPQKSIATKNRSRCSDDVLSRNMSHDDPINNNKLQIEIAEGFGSSDKLNRTDGASSANNVLSHYAQDGNKKIEVPFIKKSGNRFTPRRLESDKASYQNSDYLLATDKQPRICDDALSCKSSCEDFINNNQLQKEIARNFGMGDKVYQGASEGFSDKNNIVDKKMDSPNYNSACGEIIETESMDKKTHMSQGNNDDGSSHDGSVKEVETIFCEMCDRSYAVATFKKFCGKLDKNGKPNCLSLRRASKRKVYNSAKIRITNNAHLNVDEQQTVISSRKKVVSDMRKRAKGKKLKKPSQKWRKESSDLREVMEANRLMKKAESEGKPVTYYL